jgi:hypothetical protein
VCSEHGGDRMEEQGYHGHPPASREPHHTVLELGRANVGACKNSAKGGQSHADVHSTRATTGVNLEEQSR